MFPLSGPSRVTGDSSPSAVGGSVPSAVGGSAPVAVGGSSSVAVGGSAPVAGQDLSLRLPGGVSLELIWCPPGTFIMGSPRHGEERGSGEPQWLVTLSKGFYLGKYPVTQEQFLAVTGVNNSYFNGSSCPAEQVTWHDASVFCIRLNYLLQAALPSAYKFALPTEAQWEYACRAGGPTSYFSRSGAGEWAWHKGNSGQKTHPVGLKLPNAWGFYDMHGNVLEWCRDTDFRIVCQWRRIHNMNVGLDKIPDSLDPLARAGGREMFHVVRGGSWNSRPLYCGPTYHNVRYSFIWDRRIGFRLAAVAVP